MATSKKIARTTKQTKRPAKPAENAAQSPTGGSAELLEHVLTTMKDYGAKDPQEASALLEFYARRLKRAAEGLQPKPEAPNDSLIRNNKAFDGKEGVDPSATVGDLLALIFEAPNGSDGGGLIADVLLCNADDAAMLSYCAVNDDGMLSNVMERVAMRMEWRARVALELDKRMRAAEQAAGGAS